MERRLGLVETVERAQRLAMPAMIVGDLGARFDGAADKTLGGRGVAALELQNTEQIERIAVIGMVREQRAVAGLGLHRAACPVMRHRIRQQRPRLQDFGGLGQDRLGPLT